MPEDPVVPAEPTAQASAETPQETPPETPLPVLEADLLALAGDLAAAECRWLHMVAEFDRREGWAGVGVLSCAHWLSWRCGLSLTTAREKVRVANALVRLPKVSESFEKGELSYSRARAIVRAANPENEESLIEIARNTTGAQLERIVRATAGVQRLDEVRERRTRRTWHWHWDEDGSFILRARLEPDEGAAVLAALDAAQSRQYMREPKPLEATIAGPAQSAEAEDRRQDSLDDERDNGEPAYDDWTEHEHEHEIQLAADQGDVGPATTAAVTDEATTDHPTGADHTGPTLPRNADEQAASRADALVCVAEAFIAHDAPTAGADVFQVVVHIQDGAPPFVENGPALLLHTALRMSCDSTVYCIHQDAKGAVLDVGRTSRRISRPLRRALWQRDGGCRFPGCGRRRGVDAHHVVHWTRGGPTRLANLVLLCRRHHTLIHDGDFDVRIDTDGQPRFSSPDGAPLLEFPAATPSANDPRRWHRRPVAADAVDTHWGGERLDLSYVVSGLLQSFPDDTGTDRLAS